MTGALLAVAAVVVQAQATAVPVDTFALASVSTMHLMQH